MNICSHKQMHAQWKKQRRKKIRQAAAKSRDEAEQLANGEVDEELAATREALIREMEERERHRLNQEWLAREAKAMEDFKKMKEKEEILKGADNKTSRLQEEWEKQLKGEEKQPELDKNRNREALQHLPSKPSEANGPWHNPAPPDNFGTELDKQNCPFFLKTGACRFGDRCSRGHAKPTVSSTILIPGMFCHFSIDKAWRDEYDSDISLEYEDSERYQHFKEFYEDTLPEFKAIGHVVQFKVCCNFELHLRGNVYIQYEKEEDAIKALNSFNGRWYAGRQLSCEFSPVCKWKSAICGLYHRNKCPKGRSCNFLHVFKNPDNEFRAADYDRDPTEDDNTSTRSSSVRSHRRSSFHEIRSPHYHNSSRDTHQRSHSKSTHTNNKRDRSPSSTRRSLKRSKRRSGSRKSRSSRSRTTSSSSEESDLDKNKPAKEDAPIHSFDKHVNRSSSRKRRKHKKSKQEHSPSH